MQSISQTYFMRAPVHTLWGACTNSSSIEQWSGEPAVMSEELTDFSLWGGDVHGTTIQVIPHELLRQEINFKVDANGNEFSEILPGQVTFTFTPQGETTRIDLMHESVSDDQVEQIAYIWENSYMNPLKTFVEKSNLLPS